MSTSNKTVVRIAALGNKYGNVRIGVNCNDEKVIIVDDFAPIFGQDDKFNTGFIPYRVIIGKLNNDIRANLLIRAIAKKLISIGGKGFSVADVLDQAVRKVMGALRVKCTYVLRAEGEVYTKADGTDGKYKTNWYELLDDDIHLSFGEKKEDYLNCNVDAFIGDESLIEDF